MRTKIDFGIDLGTSCSCSSVFKNGKVEVIPNSSGNRITPSYISFLDDEILIGDSAKNNCSLNSKNTVFDVKRIIGRQYDENTVQNDIKHFPFKVSKDEKTEKPIISIFFSDGQEKTFYPEQISALLLKKFKQEAEEYLGVEITKAVVTVPAYFNNEQRQATKNAGEIAGLDIIRIINEPTAAALAYGIDINDKKEQNIVVFDLGAGTLDVSILNICDGVFKVISTCGDTHLGGEDFDNRLVVYCASEFAKQNKFTENDIIKLLNDKKAFRRLRTVCENVKKSLSSSHSMFIQVDSFYNNIDLNIKMTRDKFEDLCRNIFQRCIPPIDNALKDAKLEKNNINEIVMIGGSTRIPYIRELVKNYFNGKQLLYSVNPDEAVSNGAAIQGAILIGNDNQKINDMVLVDVTPLSLGIELSHGEMSKIIERNTPIPCTFTQLYSTSSDNQRNVKIKIFEGERLLTKDNYLLGTFELAELPPMPRGTIKITVSFDIDNNGILNVSAIEETTGKNNNIVIKKDNSKLSKEDILKLIADAELHMMNDNKNKELLSVRRELEDYMYSIKHNISKVPDTSEITIIQRTLANTLEWYNANKHEKIETYRNKLSEITDIINPIFEKINAKIISEIGTNSKLEVVAENSKPDEKQEEIQQEPHEEVEENNNPDEPEEKQEEVENDSKPEELEDEQIPQEPQEEVVEDNNPNEPEEKQEEVENDSKPDEPEIHKEPQEQITVKKPKNVKKVKTVKEPEVVLPKKRGRKPKIQTQQENIVEQKKGKKTVAKNKKK